MEDTLRRQLVAFELDGKIYRFSIWHNVPADEIKDIIDTWVYREEDTPTEDLSGESLVRYINSNFSDYYALTAGDRKNRRR